MEAYHQVSNKTEKDLIAQVLENPIMVTPLEVFFDCLCHHDDVFPLAFSGFISGVNLSHFNSIQC